MNRRCKMGQHQMVHIPITGVVLVRDGKVCQKFICSECGMVRVLPEWEEQEPEQTPQDQITTGGNDNDQRV